MMNFWLDVSPLCFVMNLWLWGLLGFSYKYPFALAFPQDFLIDTCSFMQTVCHWSRWVSTDEFLRRLIHPQAKKWSGRLCLEASTALCEYHWYSVHVIGLRPCCGCNHKCLRAVRLCNVQPYQRKHLLLRETQQHSFHEIRASAPVTKCWEWWWTCCWQSFLPLRKAVTLLSSQY